MGGLFVLVSPNGDGKGAVGNGGDGSDWTFWGKGGCCGPMVGCGNGGAGGELEKLGRGVARVCCVTVGGGPCAVEGVLHALQVMIDPLFGRHARPFSRMQVKFPVQVQVPIMSPGFPFHVQIPFPSMQFLKLMHVS